MSNYNEKIHIWGRVWMLSALFMLLMIPTIICVNLGVWPDINDFLAGFLITAAIFWTVTIIEVFTFSPMLGSGGTYLGFVTGNLFNLKVPVALNAMNAIDVKMGSQKGDIISTIAIASSTIITTIIIFIGAMLLIPLTPLLEAELVQPAFANIIPALFGALGVIYIGQNWKIAVAPLAVMMIIFIAVPNSMGIVGILIPVGCIISIISARILYTKNII